MTREVLRYQARNSRQPFTEWFLSFKDKNVQTSILDRIDRLKVGNFGDYKRVGNGVFELRIHFGPGYRIYFGIDGEKIIILLCGGDKSSQSADIQRAQTYC